MLRAALLILALVSTSPSLASADPQVSCTELGCASTRPPERPTRGRERPSHGQRYKATIVAHPAGCPRRDFCGCGTSVHFFGRPIRSLYLAANWFRFPRAAPAPGRAAVRRGHVFALLEHVQGSVWKVYDPNSGGGKTRVHYRSIAGYTIVNPHGGGQYASAR